MAATITQPLLFEDDAVGALEWRYDQPYVSSDGGAILLRRVARRLRLIDQMAAVLQDPLEPTRVQHTMRDLLAHDPAHKILFGRDPITGDLGVAIDPVELRAGTVAAGPVRDGRRPGGCGDRVAASAVPGHEEHHLGS